jgi:Ni/Fe-hydrogenase 1 B-type cytochrome subunit
MAEELKSNKAEPSFREKHSLSIRIWHWSTFVIIMGSLTTVLLAKTMLNTRSNIPLVQQSLEQNNITITAAQARAVAHEFSDKAWGWHIYLGYFLAGLFLFRIIFEFFQPQEQKLIPAIRKAMKYLKQPGIDKKYGRHYLFVKYMYVLFYFALFVQTCTGLFMIYSDNIEKLQDIRHSVSDIHSVFMWVIISYIVLHIGGVIVAELGKKDKGIVSDMINGGE